MDLVVGCGSQRGAAEISGCFIKFLDTKEVHGSEGKRGLFRLLEGIHQKLGLKAMLGVKGSNRINMIKQKTAKKMTKKMTKKSVKKTMNKSMKKTKNQNKRSSDRGLWVIKIGSQLIAEGGPLLIRSLVQQVSHLVKKKKIKVVWVSSGAIASARQRTGYQWTSLPEKQALSAIGQPLLMELYSMAFQSQGLMGAQVLLSYSDFRREESRTNLTNTIHQLLSWNVVPVLNENDAVATEEIQFGDNDQLSAMVANQLGAQRLLILTNVAGLYDRDPQDPQAQIISHVPEVTKAHLKRVRKNSNSSLGRGGMESKLLAAQKAWSERIPTTIASGWEHQIILRLHKGEKLGTQFGENKND